MRSAILQSVLFSIWLIAAQNAAAQSLAAQKQPNPSVPPNDLVRKVVTDELNAERRDHSHWMYQAVNTIPAPEKTTTVIETDHGDIHYVDDVGGSPLTGEQRSAEDKKVQQFVSDPDEQSKARRATAADDKKSAKLFAMLPDAFLFQYAGTAGDNVKLSFQPNPAFTSHSSDAYVFHKMDGFVILNIKADRLVEISGRLTHGVEFGVGLLGHLDPGGTFDVRREEVAPEYWAITKLKVNMNGKILFFKTIAVQQDEVDSHFRKIPDSTTLVEAEKMAEVQTTAGGAD